MYAAMARLESKGLIEAMKSEERRNEYRGGRNAHVMAIAPMMYLLPYLLSLRYTSLSRRSGRTQAASRSPLKAGELLNATSIVQ